MQAMVTRGGAQLVININALVGGKTYEKTPKIIVPARAFENRCYIAYVCLAGQKYLGASRVCNPFGECIVSTMSSDENMLMATIPLNTHKGVPFHYLPLRRPALYGSGTIEYEAEIPWKRENTDSVQQYFRHRACYYDDQMVEVYNAPGIAARTLASLVAEKNTSVLDVAAGTGLVGKALYEQGFTNLVALDQSEAMLEYAMKKNVYSRTILGTFKEEARKMSNGSFHVCTCVGAFLTAVFLDPVTSVEEMVRLVEIGGYVLLLWNETELNHQQCQSTKKSLESAIDRLVHSGQCELVSHATVPNYLGKCQGMQCVLKKIG